MKPAISAAILALLLVPVRGQDSVPAPGRDLVLEDGRYLHVEILGADPGNLHVRLFQTGGQVRIPWSLIREEYRQPLMVGYGYAEDAAASRAEEEGVRLVTKSGDEFLGVPVELLPPQGLPSEIVIWTQGRKQAFKREVIQILESQIVPSVAAFTPDQLYERRTAGGLPADDDAAGHLELARYCMAIDHFEKAVLHLLKVREIDPEFRPEYVAGHLERMEALSRERERAAAIRAARAEANYRRFAKAVQILDDLLTVPDLSPAMKSQAELTKEAILKARWEHYRAVVRTDYFTFLNRRIAALSRDSKLKLKDAQKELRQNLHQLVLNDIAERHGLEPKKEVPKLFQERQVFHPYHASYGSGTFIVLGQAPGAQQRQQALEQALARSLAQQQARNRGQAGSQFANLDQIRLPKAPTPDEWWAQTDSATRADWMKAYFAEYGKVLEVTGDRRDECSQCGGSGTLVFGGSQGEQVPVTCPRCHGHKHDRRIGFK
jgi:tetratricopeptide (TPR) repeat protein